MSTPTPAPRSLENKKPVPKPRQLVPIRPSRAKDNGNDPDRDRNEFNSNTFTKGIKTLSNASKQIAGDIGGRVQEGKKAVIETTRSSVRRITRRFHSNSSSEQTPDERITEETNDHPEIFNSITFDSPLSCTYNNSDTDDYNSPPPPYPPPPLREENYVRLEESYYDAPQSLSDSTSSSGNSNFRNNGNDIYESVFPVEFNSSLDSTDGNVKLNRSESWKFYGQVPKTEQLYNNVDSTPLLNPDSASVSVMRTNSLYENHEIETREKDEVGRITQSVILQFDPLTNVDSTYSNDANDLSCLEELLLGDLFGNVTPANTIDNWSISNESDDIEEYISPPAPPERFDSLPEESSPVTKRKETSKSNWYTPSPSPLDDNANKINQAGNHAKPSASSSSVSSSMKAALFKHVNDVFKKAPQFVKGHRNKESYLQRPTLGCKTSVQQRGLLYKVTNGPVEDLFGEFNSRWCVLEGQGLLCHTDNTCNTIKENFPLESILSVQLLEDQKYKYKYDNEDIHCFELNTSGKSRGGHIYGSKSQSERRVWMQKIAESLTGKFGSRITSDYQRMGWAYIREGVSGQWVGAWIILSKRTLHYVSDNSSGKTVDLRKARCITLQGYAEKEAVPRTTDKGPNLLVDCQSGSVYFRMWTGRETKVWCHIIRLAAHNNGLHLDQQQLTKNDVPVIVEKCINFIYVYGSMTKGIYRCAGSSSNINDILTQFRTDAWSTQLTPNKYTEHDVASALKRFFRDLPEPLIMKSKQQYFYQVSLVKNKDERIRMYRAAFDDFPKVTVNTIRRLLAHLSFIASQSGKNLMDIENVSSVWGMTLIKPEVHSNETFTNKDSEVIADLIQLYRDIFPENQQDIEKERTMLSVLEKYHDQMHTKLNNTKVTGDFRIWIYLNSKEGASYNVSIGPHKTAYHVCSELSSKMELPVDKLQLEEFVLGGNLRRPVHHTEKVLDVVLKWGYWDEADRKDNVLILVPLAKYETYFSDKVIPIVGELRFADSRSRIFKSFMFDFSKSILSYYKDKQCINTIESWKIEDMVWYFGHDQKRNAATRHTITFFRKDDKPNRTRSSPYFGNCLVFQDEAFLVTWISYMWKAAHQIDFLPPPQHVSLIDS